TKTNEMEFSDMATQEQIEANRRNALRSTGPRTEADKARSSRNSLQHGLAGTGTVLTGPFEEEVTQAEARWYVQNGRDCEAATDREKELVRIYVVEVRRLLRNCDEQFRLEHESMRRAADSWEEDRSLAAVEVARRLPIEPEMTVHRLKQTAQGCDW